MVSAADLAVADEGAAEAFAEVEEGEIGECAGPGVGLFGAGGPVHVVVGLDGAVDEGREDVGGESSPTRNGASGRWTSRPVPRSTGSAALTTARWARPASRAPARGASATSAGRAGGSGERPFRPPHGVPVDVDGFDDDGRGG